jgi:hypothetical protein
VDGYVVVREKVKILLLFTNAVMVQISCTTWRMQSPLDPTLWNYTRSNPPKLLLVTLYLTLLELAVDQDVTAETKETIIKRSGFPLVALGVTCDDVGAYKEDESPNAMTV